MTKLITNLSPARRNLLICLTLAAVTAAVYWPVVLAQFLTMDDPAYITDNPVVQRGLTWQGVVWAFSEPHVANYHPVTWLSHMLDCEVFGVSSAWHHAVNLLFHCANVVLVYLVLRSMTGRNRCSAIVAALFAVHPLHVESVAWVAERKDVLSGLFFLLTLAAWTAYVRSSTGVSPVLFTTTQQWRSARATWWWYAAALALFALGLLSKPMLVTVPCVLLLLDVWPLGRTRWVAAESVRTDEDPPTRNISFLLIEKIPFLVLAIGAGVMTIVSQDGDGAMATFEQAPLGLRVGNALVAYVRYVGNFLWPANLAAFYPLSGFWPTPKVVACAFALLIITATLLWMSRRRPYLGIGWLLFAGMLVPVIGLLQVGSQAMADRYMYLPILGLAIILVWVGAELAPKIGPRRGMALLSVLLLSFAAITAQDVRWWQNSEVLFTRALEVTEPNAFTLHNIASALLQRGQTAQAVARYEQCIKLQPGNPHLRRALGHALKEDKRYAEALEQLAVSIRIEAKDARTWAVLGHVYMEQNNWSAAAEHFAVAAELNRDDYDSRINLAVAYRQCNRPQLALASLQEAVKLSRRDPKPWYMVGCLLLETDQPAAAVEPLQRSLALDGRNADAHYRLGLALMGCGHGERAIAPLMTAVQLSPNSPEPLTKLAWLLATSPDAKLRSGPDALFLAERANALAKSSPQVLFALAAALAEQQKFADAAKVATEAAELAEVEGNLALRTKLQAAAAEYRAGHATRDATLAGTDAGEIAP